MSKSDQTGAVMLYYDRPMPKVLPPALAADPISMTRPEPLQSALRQDLCRRSNFRYPIATDVVYHLVKDGEILAEGRGRTMNISSGGILLCTETAVPAGVIIELQIVWPVRLDQQVDLNLHIHGRTMRSEGNCTGVAISRYEFRTRRKALAAAGAGIVSI